MSLGRTLGHAIAAYRAMPDLFRPEFDAFLVNGNYSVIFIPFEREANWVWEVRGRHKFAAEVIVQSLRHYSMVSDVKDEKFKLNAKWTGSMARLYALRNPTRADMFEYRRAKHPPRIIRTLRPEDFILADTLQPVTWGP